MRYPGETTGLLSWGAVWVNSVSLDAINPFSSISLDLKQSLSPGYINTYNRHVIGYTTPIGYRGSVTLRISKYFTDVLGHLIHTRPWGLGDESACPHGSF